MPTPWGSAQARRTVEVVTAALVGYGLPDAKVVDAVRMIRAALHGFVDIELRGGFAMSEPVEGSFQVLVDSLDAALTALGGEAIRPEPFPGPR